MAITTKSSIKVNAVQMLSGRIQYLQKELNCKFKAFERRTSHSAKLIILHIQIIASIKISNFAHFKIKASEPFFLIQNTDFSIVFRTHGAAPKVKI
jgi:hypothetical protein